MGGWWEFDFYAQLEDVQLALRKPKTFFWPANMTLRVFRLGYSRPGTLRPVVRSRRAPRAGLGLRNFRREVA